MVSIATLDNALSEHPAFIANRPSALVAMRRVWGAVREWQACFEAMGASPQLVQTPNIDRLAIEGMRLDPC